jgi:hypothetical protein
VAFGGEDHVFIEERTNNVIRVGEKDTEQDGELLRRYYRYVANLVQPNLVQEAIFSFTVLRAGSTIRKRWTWLKSLVSW